MVINEGNQGDWQELDPRVADVVRGQEQQLLQNIVNISALEVRQLFDGTINDATMAGRVVTELDASTGGIDADVQTQIRAGIQTELVAVRTQEQLLPAGGAIERVQRQTKEFAAAVRRAIPADIFDRVGQEFNLPAGATHTPTIDIGTNTAISNIDLSHAFWLNRIQDRAELVASLTGVPVGQLGIVHPGIAPAYVLTAADAQHIADSTTPPSGNALWEVLLRHNTKTLLSDEQVSSLNIQEATELVMQNAQVRRAIAPRDADLERQAQRDLIAEKNVAAVIPQLTALDVPDLTPPLTSWGAIDVAITAVDGEKSTLGVGGPNIDLPSIGVTGFTPSTTPSIRNQEIGNLMNQLNERKRELKELDAKFLRFSSVLAGVIQDVRAVQTVKTSGPTLADGMLNAAGAPQKNQFNVANTPAAVAANLRTVLTLRSSESEYDVDIEARRKAVTDAEAGKDQLVGREAVLKVFDTHNRQVERLDARKSEEATHTRYARNEMNREENTARGDAVEDLVGRPQRVGERATNTLHNIGHGSPQEIVCKIAESNEVNASTAGTRSIFKLGMRKSSAEPKWSALPYPRLITAFAALRKVGQDTASPIHIRNTTYYQNQMRTITNLLATRYAEQVERDFARETESEDQRTDRKAQGERNRKQRLIRLLMHNELPATYSDRADGAIKEAAGRIRVIQRGIGRTVAWTGGAIKNRSKNVFLGEGSNKNPLTYPAKATKGIARFLVTPLA